MAHGPWAGRTVCQLAIVGTANGQQVVTVHHFQAEAGLEGTLVSDQVAQNEGANLAATWIAQCKNSYVRSLAGSYSMVMVRAQVVERPGNRNHRLTPTEDPETGQGNAGDVNLPGQDNQAAAVIRWRTARAGKSYRGRTYLGPLADAWQANGRLTSTAITDINNYVTAMLVTFGAGTPAGTSSWALTIYSRPYDQGDYGYPRGSHPNRVIYYPPDYNGSAQDVTTGAVDSILRSQRRRQIGVGA